MSQIADRPVESDLAVLWQRHLPEGWQTDEASYLDLVTGVGMELVGALVEHRKDLAKGDLVVTLSRRPPLSVAS